MGERADRRRGSRRWWVAAGIALCAASVACEPDPVDTVDPGGASVSQGTFLGVVHLIWEPVEGAAYYNIEHSDAAIGEWLGAGSVTAPPFDDYGFSFPDNRLVSGHHYRYRIVSASPELGDSEPQVLEGEGWMAEPAPVRGCHAQLEADGRVTITFEEGNDLSTFVNLTSVTYELQRGGRKVATTSAVEPMADSFPGTDPTYRIVAKYRYTYKNMDWGTSEGLVQVEGPEFQLGGGSGDTVDLTFTPQGEASASSGGIAAIDVAEDDAGPIVALLADADAAGNGIPALYRLAAAGPTPVAAPYPAELTASTSLSRLRLAAGGAIYLAGIDHDGVRVYRHDGSWSGPLGGVLPAGDADIALAGGTLYLAIDRAAGEGLALSSWDGSAFTGVVGDGTLEAGATVFEPRLEVIDQTLYLHYLVDPGSGPTTFVIAHLASGTLVEDLRWSADGIVDLHLVPGSSSPLTFISGSSAPASFPGGVYQVTSKTGVASLLPTDDPQNAFPVSAALDAQGALLVAGLAVESQSSIHLSLNLYEDGAWRRVTRDLTSEMPPVVLASTRAGLLYLRGDASRQTAAYQPSVILVDRVTR